MRFLKVFLFLTSVTSFVFGQNRVVFNTLALNIYNYCEDLQRNDCLFFQEARDKCGSVCADRIQNGNPNNNNNNNRGDGNTGRSRGSGTAGASCFSGDSKVLTNFGLMKMSDLLTRKSIQVLSRGKNNALEFSTVHTWLHANASLESPFLAITTEHGQTLVLTEAHLIYETDCRGNVRTILAKKVKIGNCVYVIDNGTLKESKIVGRELKKRIGVYAPITENGNIVVDDVLVSCFTNFENEPLMKIMFSMWHKIPTFLPNFLVEMMFDASFPSTVDVSYIALSFVDLSKAFLSL